MSQKSSARDATRCIWNMTAYGSLHLARKAEQVPQGLRNLGSSKRTCPLCYLLFIAVIRIALFKKFKKFLPFSD